MATFGMNRVLTDAHSATGKAGVRIHRRRRADAAPVEQPHLDSIKRFLRTIDLTAVQLQAAFPHVGLLLHALAAFSPRNPAVQRTVASPVPATSVR